MSGNENVVMKAVWDIVRHDDKEITADERVVITNMIANFMEQNKYCCGGWTGTPNNFPNPHKLEEQLSEARADALRMARIAIYLESCAESRFDTGDHSSEKREANEIIAKYEEKQNERKKLLQNEKQKSAGQN